MPRYRIVTTIEVDMTVTADTPQHAQELFEQTDIREIADLHGDLQPPEFYLIPEQPKSWSPALGPLGP